MPETENLFPFETGDAIARDAADWLVRRDEGLSDEESAAFAEWRARDPRHAQAFDRAAQAHALLLRVPEEFFNASVAAKITPLPRRKNSFRRKTALQVLGTASLAAACWFFVARQVRAPAPERASVFYACDSADHRFVDLADGSTLVLQRGSEVAVNLTASARHLELQRGETRFIVAKDPARPFLVTAGAVTVRAVGTVFQVRRQADNAIDVAVTEGKVQVSRNDAPAHPSAAEPPVFLVAGERVSIGAAALATPADVAPKILRDEDASSGSRLVLNNTPLKEVVARFNHSSRMQMEIADPRLNEMPVGGVFDVRNADAFIHLIEASGDIRVEHVSETRVLLYSAR